MKEKQRAINTEKKGMDERLVEQIAELERRLKEVEAENIVLRELAYQSEQRYEQIKQLMKENNELRRQLQQLPQSEETSDVYEEEKPDSWFFHTLRHENAIVPIQSETKKNEK